MLAKPSTTRLPAINLVAAAAMFVLGHLVIGHARSAESLRLDMAPFVDIRLLTPLGTFLVGVGLFCWGAGLVCLLALILTRSDFFRFEW